MGRLCRPLAFWQEIRKKHRPLIVSWGAHLATCVMVGQGPCPWPANANNFSPSAFGFPGHLGCLSVFLGTHFQLFYYTRRVLGFFQCGLLAGQI